MTCRCKRRATFRSADHPDSPAKFRPIRPGAVSRSCFRSWRSRSCVEGPSYQGQPRGGRSAQRGHALPLSWDPRRRQEDSAASVVSSALLRRASAHSWYLCWLEAARVILTSLNAISSAFPVIQGIILKENVPNCSHEIINWWEPCARKMTRYMKTNAAGLGKERLS